VSVLAVGAASAPRTAVSGGWCQPVVAATRHSDRLDAALRRLQSRFINVERFSVSAKKKTARRTMSDEHKQAIADARRQNQVVRDYLNALTTTKPAGHRPSATPEQLQEQIDAESDPVKRLELIQRRLDLEDRLAAEQEQPDLDSLQDAFVAVAADYATRKGITYTAFRELGVPAPVLQQAGIPRTRRSN
jgi:ribosomal protein S21